MVDIKGKVCLNDFEMFLEGMTGEKVDAVVSCDEMFGVCIWRQKKRFVQSYAKTPCFLAKDTFFKSEIDFY